MKSTSTESKINTDLLSNRELLEYILIKENRPLKSSIFKLKIEKLRANLSPSTFGVMLNFGVKQGYLIMHKIPGTPAYYGLPEWYNGLLRDFHEQYKPKVK